jgi:hypothetical protein
LLNLEEEKELADALSEFAGQTFNVRFSKELKPPDPFRVGDWTFEQSNCVGQLTRILSAAGWIEVHIMLADNPVVSSGVTLFISEQSAHKAGFALYGSLAKLLISSQPCFVRADEIRSQILHGPQYPALNAGNPGAVLPMIIVVGPL